MVATSPIEIPHMTEAEYRALDAMNWSTLGAARKSLADLKERIDHPREDKECFALGRATHTLTLEPGAFDARYAVWSGADRRTTAGKKEWAKFAEESAGKEILDVEDWDNARKMADSVLSNRDAVALLSGGDIESPRVWTDADYGIRCKGRLDYVDDLSVVDLKTTKDASPRKFASAAYAYGYFSQLAFYVDGAAAYDQKERSAYIIAVETARPYICQVYAIPPADLEIGRYEYKRLLAEYKSALASGEWPGYSRKTLPLSVPRWAVNAMEAQAENEDAEQSENDPLAMPF